MPAMTAAIIRELEREKDYLSGETIETIYFGGGTPSLLDEASLHAIFEAINQHFKVAATAEITLEANPDDLTREKIASLRRSPINRLSIGIQTFQDQTLSWMNRTHTAQEAAQSIEWCVEAGFTALSLDLIYGIPSHNAAIWASDLKKILEYRPDHISCYCLTVEEKTALHSQIKKGMSPAPNEDQAIQQFEYLIDTATAAGYHQYEISNFALPGKEARHNQNYWYGVPYLGVGPAAHSHKKGERRWNIANNALYIQGMKTDLPNRETEKISKEQEYHEYLMTRLRTSGGCNTKEIAAFGERFKADFEQKVQIYTKNGQMTQIKENQYALTRSGKMLSDAIILAFFLD
jgi:oxygen-independent coproporphyrinogen III oxidase